MTQNERLNLMIQYLCNENGIELGKDLHVTDTNRENIFRALMNIRRPIELSQFFLTLHESYFNELNNDKKIISIEQIPTLQDQYGINNHFSDKLSIWQGDITLLKVDAIVNAANPQLQGCFIPCHDCIDNAIHTAAGVQLRMECASIMEKQMFLEPVGTAKITNGYHLPARHVIHTVGPMVRNTVSGNDKLMLSKCYEAILDLACKNDIKTLAICCISTGEYHFPNDIAARIAIQTVIKYLQTHGDLFDRIIFNVFKDIDASLYNKTIIESFVD